MKHYIGHHQVVAGDDATELALDLWLGLDGETDEERSARLDAGRDILAADPALFDRAVRAVVRTCVKRRTSVRVDPLRRPRVDGEEVTAA